MIGSVRFAMVNVFLNLWRRAIGPEVAVAYREKEAAERARRRAEAEAPVVRRDGTVAPTEATERKRVISAVAALILKRQEGGAPHGIDPECGRAAAEIHDVFLATTAGLWTKTAKYGERLDKGVGGDAIERLAKQRERYLRWVARPGQQRSVGAGGAMVVDLVLDAVVEGMGVRQIADRRGMDQRTVERRLRESLEEYCAMAGWMQVARAA